MNLIEIFRMMAKFSDWLMVMIVQLLDALTKNN